MREAGSRRDDPVQQSDWTNGAVLAVDGGITSN
jgi:hypothetical protein